jgi:hypothetical protein
MDRADKRIVGSLRQRTHQAVPLRQLDETCPDRSVWQ